ncbi:MarR family transcriptional regulator [Erysipelothrix larvae]|uniref:MarR family transcriptional regulator n=1 Tax=Erysipelothrix larvae TaxID=1514105 RepID=A0A0X8H239_9FIRM|nr:MarR family transcriptional regulator [Erysipelothrix larvae]AMC94534.1 MarR family transcriptional regulator [Erysipelothrix larvae]
MDNKDRVLKLLKESDKPLKAVNVVEILEIDRKEVDKAFKELKKEGLITSPKACFYTAE